MSSEGPAGTPGAMIAAARSKRGLSVADLAERTRIPPAMVEALEADEYHRLSGPLYARSFLRSCALELGLDAGEVLERYARHAGEPARPGEGMGVPAPAVRIRRVGLPWGRLAAGALVVAGLGVAAAWFVLRQADPAAPDRPVTQAAAGGATASLAGPGTVGDRATGALVADAPPPSSAGAPAGLPGLAFSDGLTWPLVVRLKVAAPGTARARRDGEAGYADTAWPGGAGAGPVPREGVVAGQAYADGDGLVVYWGAVERLSLVLGGLAGAELTVNGRPWPLTAPADGGEIVVDVEAGAGPLP